MYPVTKMWRVLKLLGLLYVFLLFFSLSPKDAVDVFRAIGEDVVLSLPRVESPIQSVQWNHNGDIAAEMYGNEVHCFLQFKGRCEVNTDTGELTIKGLNLNDSGVYTPEINYKVFYKIELSVICRVAKPSVKTSCNTEKTSCNLTCEGSTAEARPVVYKWFLDGRDGPAGGLLIITKDTKKNSFSCFMMNPVSNETSESITNPFIIKEEPNRLASVLVPVGVIVLVVIVVVVSIFICKIIIMVRSATGRGEGWSLSQQSLGKRRGTPWTGRQSTAGLTYRDRQYIETDNQADSQSHLRTPGITHNSIHLSASRRPKWT